MELNAKNIMTTEVVTVNEDASVYEGMELLISTNTNCLPVVDSFGKLLGIVTETDLIYIDKKLSGDSHYAYAEMNTPVDLRVLKNDLSRLNNIKIGQVMTTKLITVREDTSLEKILDIIINKKIKTIPVVTDTEIVGIITRKNILKYYLK
ncbi:CBS domain-containing protein [Alkaliphilus transvaalensis]|uniref:CBS domain-containing protein n=1 Tax=Alkaliphilus transvaalensis TaxID=114628 RepID=UPI00047CEC63|nr:CBS domain-containing protein [Alkaliphilus transvaalensis]